MHPLTEEMRFAIVCQPLVCRQIRESNKKDEKER
jgi:hypothetical protein